MRYAGSEEILFTDSKGDTQTLLEIPDQTLYDDVIEYDKLPETDLDLAAVKLWGEGSEPRYYILFDANAINIMELKNPFDISNLKKLNVPV